MADIYQSTKDRFRDNPWLYPTAVFALALVARFGYLSRILQGSYGIRTPPDTNTFLRTCDVLFTDPTAIVAQTKGIQYLGFTVPFCTVDQLSGGSGLAWVLVQIVLSAITAVLVYHIAKQLANEIAGLVAGFSFAILFDTFRFAMFLLSETVFTFALVLSIWALVQYRVTPTRRARVSVIISLGLLAISRPFGPPIVAGWILLEALPRESKYRTGFLPRPIAIATLVAIPVVMFLFSSAPSKLVQIERGWREGWIMYKGKSNFIITEYAYSPRSAGSLLAFIVFNVDHIVILGVVRTLVLFVPLIGGGGFSPFWTALNVAVLGPLTVLGFYGLLRGRQSHPALLSVVAIPLVVVVGIVAITFVSLSWRYRAPLGPVLAIIAGYVVGTNTRVQNTITWVDERVTSQLQ
ncbi:glycosyltransferase family 39 protein [Halorhabdus sp. BNX81]|uniref:ArnT family glycosyltransferase n=1 Tax=Halorhabdus sp. BNX81 TaxID=2980181 RepID=UPI0023DD1AA8|nr:glycosyltransferase family 39 protein [Halorhabdus sp. BNX81]WEL20550.1 Glycosyl transferase family 39 [Halorhabdus sp. BNX81]